MHEYDLYDLYEQQLKSEEPEFDNYDDFYAAYMDDLKHDIQIRDYESRMGY